MTTAMAPVLLKKPRLARPATAHLKYRPESAGKGGKLGTDSQRHTECMTVMTVRVTRSPTTNPTTVRISVRDGCR